MWPIKAFLSYVTKFHLPDWQAACGPNGLYFLELGITTHESMKVRLFKSGYLKPQELQIPPQDNHNASAISF
jgi:hypothetical protein